MGFNPLKYKLIRWSRFKSVILRVCDLIKLLIFMLIEIQIFDNFVIFMDLDIKDEFILVI